MYVSPEIFEAATDNICSIEYNPNKSDAFSYGLDFKFEYY